MNYWYNKKNQSDIGATAKSAPINSSVYKLNLVARLIKGMSVDLALLQLQFLNKKASKIFHDVVKCAASNAEHNFALDINQLYIKHVRVNKSFVLRRNMAKAKGRAASIRKPYSVVSVFVADKSREESVK